MQTRGVSRKCTSNPLNRNADFELYLPLGFPGRSLNFPKGWNPGVGRVLTLHNTPLAADTLAACSYADLVIYLGRSAAAHIR